MITADIHTHILYGVDDGASTIEESLKMLELEALGGTELVFLTPHFINGRNRYTTDILKERFEELCRLTDITLRLGNECYYDRHLISNLNSGEALTMGGSDYVLLEFDYSISQKKILDGCRDLYNNGYRVILAHIERYEAFDKGTVEELKSMDTKFQINASYAKKILSSLSGRGRKPLLNGEIDFIASDAHGTRHRRPNLDTVTELMIRKYPHIAEKVLYGNAVELGGMDE